MKKKEFILLYTLNTHELQQCNWKNKKNKINATREIVHLL